MSPPIHCVYAAHCLDKDCDWTAEGNGTRVGNTRMHDANKAAERHTRDEGHATITSSRPEGAA